MRQFTLFFVLVTVMILACSSSPSIEKVSVGGTLCDTDSTAGYFGRVGTATITYSDSDFRPEEKVMIAHVLTTACKKLTLKRVSIEIANKYELNREEDNPLDSSGLIGQDGMPTIRDITLIAPDGSAEGLELAVANFERPTLADVAGKVMLNACDIELKEKGDAVYFLITANLERTHTGTFLMNIWITADIDGKEVQLTDTSRAYRFVVF